MRWYGYVNMRNDGSLVSGNHAETEVEKDKTKARGPSNDRLSKDGS